MTTVSVVGAGKMGLPLACQFSRRGAHVIACDANQAVVEAINDARCPFDEPGVPELLAEGVAARRLEATTDTVAAVHRSEVVVVIVPALLTAEREADTSILEAVSRQIARGMKPGLLVSYETTLPVGATRGVLVPLLEEGGLKAGRDFGVAFSPERVKSRLALARLTMNPKVVGGIDAASAQRAAEFYGEFLGAPVMNVGSVEAAEMVKLAGMVYRDVNIALANELARYAESVGVDLPALLGAINSDGEASLLTPGIGVGGHCTPVYPYFLFGDAERRGVPATLSERGRRINDEQASHLLDRLASAAGDLAQREVLLLGLAFRPQVKEDTHSTAFILREELTRRGARVRLHDPLFSEAEVSSRGFEPGSLGGPDAPEIIVLNTAHPAYLELPFGDLRRRGLRAVLDGRNAWAPETVRGAGLIYVGVGRPSPETSRPAPFLPIAKPWLGAAEAAAAAAVVRSGWLMQGPQVEAFEREFAAWTGAQQACAVSSGTAALHLALLAAGVGPGDEVVTVSHSFIATANSIRLAGAEPVFVDVEPGTFNLDPALLEAVVSPRTKAILCVHQLGMPCDLMAILRFARARGTVVIEDAACAVGSEILWDGRWERIGRPHGDIACFSFHPRKVATTGEGGMVTTARHEWDARVRLLRQHGLVPATAGGSASFLEVGFNYRMTDIQAAIGREQLRRLPAMVARRRQIGDLYRNALAVVAGLQLPAEPAWARSNWQSFCVRLPGHVDAEAVARRLAGEGIATRPGVMNAHEQPAHRNRAAGARLPESERAASECLMLPCSHDLTAGDVRRVAEALAEACRSTGEPATVGPQGSRTSGRDG